MPEHERINYVELPAANLEATKEFFDAVFGWEFTDYGSDYSSFSADTAGLDGGFYRSELTTRTDNGAALVILFSSNLEQSLARIEIAGGRIIRPIFAFPGGRRFQFLDPSGNEFAVWSHYES